MGEASTDTLRQLAPKWTLKGDDTLLTILQTTHQKIVSKCHEVNTKLEEMVSSLDDASIHLQNVNNKFMSLSNRQFIESRVYDDDADLTTDTQINKEPPQPSLPDDLSILKNSLAILDSTHEITEIIDESDSDSDAEISVVLKPKDMYSNRPLPYIIGTQQWKTKWHAGLLVEDSDSESIQSKENTEMEYSDSDIEEQTDRHIDNTISESSSLQSDRVPEPNLHTPAQVAASIASVMAQTQPVIERPITPPQKESLPRKPPAIYKPQQPIASTVFPDEPPPLDRYESDSSEHDIFAEINKVNKNKPVNNKINNNVAGDLFGFGDNSAYSERNRGHKPVEELFGNSYSEIEPQPVKQKPPVIEQQLTSDSLETQTSLLKEQDENITKKPIGGIYLFGSNKNTDTIGAAILKRNLRRSSTSDESGSDEAKTDTFKQKTEVKQNVDEIDNNVAPKKEDKDLFEDLFGKKDIKVQKVKDATKTLKNETKKKEVDLFSDNIFDDVDDIFSSNVQVTSKTAQPSLFDSDDDLFSDIAKPKTVKPTTSVESKSKTVEKLFESDDELFNDLKSTKIDNRTKQGVTTGGGGESTKIATIIEKVEVSEQKSTKTDSEITKGRGKEEKSTKKDVAVEKVSTNTDVTKEKETKSAKTDQSSNNKSIKAKSIFDSDSDDDIFNFNKPSTQKSSIENSSAKSLKADVKKFQSPSLFDDDEIDDLFNNSKNNNTVPNNTNLQTESNEQGNAKSVSKTLETKSQLNTDENIITTHTKVIIEKEVLKTNKEGSNLIGVTVKQSKTDIHIQGADILDKEKVVLNTEAESSKSIEGNSQNVSENLDPELIKPKINKENSGAKQISKPEVSIFKDTITKEKQGLHENVIEETINGGLFNEPLFSNETNENEIIQEKLNDKTPESPENLFIKSFDGHRNTQDQEEEEDQPKVPVLEEKIFNDEPNINKDLPIPNENSTQVSKTSENLPPLALFDDILTEPPVFEKTKEPKKSKNVNALFDDDSEDEALFFKKNDVISDVKPDIFSNQANFGLFTDEPPAIDDIDSDLFSKNDEKDSLFSNDRSPYTNISATENDNIGDDKSSLTKNYDDESMITKNDLVSENTGPKFIQNDANQNESDYLDKKSHNSKLVSDNIIKTNIPKDNLFDNSSDEELITDKLPKLPEKTIITGTQSIFDDLDIFTTKKTTTDSNIFSQDLPKKTVEDVKKIGKLNTQNININVQALMPGASPKKVKVDAQNIEPKIVEVEPKLAEVSELNVSGVSEQKASEVINPKMVKSISFEDSPDTDVLDNNVSKTRAKIQVKRRPSSRKARHEAVRKSIVDTDKVVDIEDEDLDINKGSLDVNQEGLDTNKGFLDIGTRDLDAKTAFLDIDQVSLDIEKVRHEPLKKSIVDTDKKIIDTEGTIDKKVQSVRIKYEDGLEVDKGLLDTNKQIPDTDNSFLDKQTKDYEQQNKNVTKLEQTLDNTIKIDNTSDYNKNIVTTDSYSKNKENVSPKNEIKTQDKSTKIVYVLNDEDIFQTNEKDLVETPIKTEQSTKKETTKISLFDNDLSKGESSQAKTKKDKTNNEKTKTKISLFDSDDEDDKSLFKTKPIVKKTKLFDSDSDDDLFSSTKTKNAKTKDTLLKKSLFDDENDEELFGAKNDKLDKKSTSSTSKESSKKTIFADPLTLFGDD